MFSWIKSWFVRDKFDVYHPGKRLIYSYFDGKKIRQVDPMVIYRAERDIASEIAIDVAAANSVMLPEKKVIEGQKSLTKNLRKVFDVPAYADGGLTDKELVDCYNHFLEFCDTVKKNSKQSQTSLPKVEDSTLPSAGNPPTSNSSESGSTEKDPSIDKPEQQLTGQQLP